MEFGQGKVTPQLSFTNLELSLLLRRFLTPWSLLGEFAGSSSPTFRVNETFCSGSSSLILFQNIVPISLVITVELVKTIQAFFIYQDLNMYYEPVSTTLFSFEAPSLLTFLVSFQLDQPCLPKTWNISDDLGQIEYVFSDKTGTLTQNIMDFQKATIGGIAYGEGITEG